MAARSGFNWDPGLPRPGARPTLQAPSAWLNGKRRGEGHASVPDSSRWAARSSWSASVISREAATSVAYDDPPAGSTGSSWTRPVAATRAKAAARKRVSAKSPDHHAAEHLVDERADLVGAGRLDHAGDDLGDGHVRAAAVELGGGGPRVGVHPAAQEVEPPQRTRPGSPPERRTTARPASRAPRCRRGAPPARPAPRRPGHGPRAPARARPGRRPRSGPPGRRRPRSPRRPGHPASSGGGGDARRLMSAHLGRCGLDRKLHRVLARLRSRGPGRRGPSSAASSGCG